MGEGANTMTDDRMTDDVMTDDMSTADPMSESADAYAATDDDPQVVILEAEIVQTRDEMTDTVAAIGDRLDPGNIVQGAKETVRDATVGKVERMSESASQTVGELGSTAQEAVTPIVDTIRRNPVPVALIGVGLGWLLMNRQNQGGGTSRTGWSNDAWDRGGADWRNDAWRTGTNDTMYGGSGAYGGTQWSGSNGGSNDGGPMAAVGEQVGQVTDQIGQVTDQLGQKAGDVGRRAGDVADQARQTAQRLPDEFGYRARGVTSQAQELLHTNPIAAAAIAVAVGTAVGLALPPTPVEQRVMGNAGTKLIDQAESAATSAIQQMDGATA
jgi:ElaB/YqjD/DUF883 family membrane-anchored ribosome-binding protein